MNTFLIAVSSVVISVAAQFCLKAGMMQPGVKAALAQPMQWRTLWEVGANGFVLAGFGLYGIGALVWLAVLARWEVSKAYPIVGLGFVFAVAGGALMGESVTTQRFGGVALICAGVWLVGRS